MSFQSRLAERHESTDQHSSNEFLGCLVQADPYSKRIVVVKTKERDTCNYSFSLDQIRAYDWLSDYVSVIIKTQSGREYPWYVIRNRMDTTPTRFQVVTLS